jgi:hypothetical protein
MPNKTKNTLKVLKKNMREEKTNLNLTPHTTVFHQFPIEAMVGPGIRTGIEKIFSLSGSSSFNVFLYSIFQPSVSSSIRRFYACNAPPLPYPAAPTPNLVVSRPRPLDPVPHPPQKKIHNSHALVFAHISTMLFLCANAFSKARTLHSIPKNYMSKKYLFFKNYFPPQISVNIFLNLISITT